MGWKNAVDIIQEAHKTLLTGEAPLGAELPPDRFIEMNRAFPQVVEDTPRDFFSVYVDNFDQTKIVLTTKLAEYTFRPSGEQIGVRAAYDFAGVAREESKACEGSTLWATLGAELRGCLLYTSPSPRD